MARRLAHPLAVEVHAGLPHPDELTGGGSIFELWAHLIFELWVHLGRTRHPHHHHALRELDTYCSATDPTWAPRHTSARHYALA